MKVYFSGISGTGIGPLAELAQDAGCEICGSDLQRGAIADEIDRRGVAVSYGNQDGSFLQQKVNEGGIDWFVYTSALPVDHAELVLAKKLGLKVSKRDEFLAELVRQKQLKMVAVAGTHGKTTTTAMLIWTMQRLKVPASYLIGTTLTWGNGGNYDPNSQYFIYEADEYDRNFLAYSPYLAVITCVDYDHPDIYKTPEDYRAAFEEFKSHSQYVVEAGVLDSRLNLIGELRRKDANLAFSALKTLRENDAALTFSDEEIIAALNQFPGAGRRFEQLTTGVFSDYGHHPNEIKATVEMAKELKERDGFAGVAIVYQPHQNVRQHMVRAGYKDAFIGADKIFWLPTYLTREDPNLAILTPEELISGLENRENAESAKLDDELATKLRDLRAKNWLIVLVTAGPADTWFRTVFNQ